LRQSGKRGGRVNREAGMEEKAMGKKQRGGRERERERERSRLRGL